MMETHFGLSRRPFPASPAPASYYPATNHERVLSGLQSGLDDGEGLLLLTGVPGVGKTMVGLCLVERLGETVEVAFLTHTHIRDRADLLQAILFDLSLPHQGLTEQGMRLALVDHLLKTFASGKRTVLIIDEAHHLGTDLLEELRMLGNLEGAGGKAVQVVLLAQPSLLDVLHRPELASLRQRLVVRVALEPLSIEEAADYLLHHMRVAGGRSERLFNEEALELLSRGAQGLPRVLSQAGSLALRFAAEAENAEVDAEAVTEALTVLGLEVEPVVSADEEIAAKHVEAGVPCACRLFRAPPVGH